MAEKEVIEDKGKADEAGKADPNKLWMTILRIIAVCCGVALSVLGVLKFFSFSSMGVRGFFLGFYYVIFGIIVCLSELRWERLLNWFFFLRFYLGKAVFFLFLATLIFTWSEIYYLVISIVFFVVSGMYFILLCTSNNKDYSGTEANEPNGVYKREEYTNV